MNSKQIKTSLLYYWKYKRNCCAGTESYVSWGIADILAISWDLKKSYEIEIKNTFPDFMNEFRKKEQKHNQIRSGKSYTEYALGNANFFYYCFPDNKKLIDKCTPLIEKLNPKYGIMRIDSNSASLDFNKSVYIPLPVIIKKGCRLNKNDNKNIYECLVKRIANELPKLYGILYESYSIKKPIKGTN